MGEINLLLISIDMPEFNYPPSLSVLQALRPTTASLSDDLNGLKQAQDLDDLTKKLTNLSKAVRLWYTLQTFVDSLFLESFNYNEFTDREWRDYLYISASIKRDDLPNISDGCICTKGIKDILFEREADPEEKWSEWKQSIINFYQQRGVHIQSLEFYLRALELKKPFYTTGATILGDLKALSSPDKNFLSALSYSKFQLLDKFPSILAEERQIVETEEIPTNSKQDPSYLMGDFRSFAYIFSEPIREIQRFYIHTDYNIPFSDNIRVNQYLKKLRENWKKENSKPCKLKYNSASRKDKVLIFDAVVYPVCLYYYQRAFYLCAFGSELKAKSELQSKSNWYNYRLDRIEELEFLDWDKDRYIISDSLRDKCNRADEIQLIDEVKGGIENGYGFDFYLPLETMVLRFDREFHDRYIQNTFRHQTFASIRKGELLKTYPNLKTTVDCYPDSAYYKMNYRVGDNSVIMRLRAWGQNVEVLAPIDLRKRMYDDMKNTWNMYQKDIYPEDK
jgi:CRISPR-associated protein (TIGR03985 family)